MWNGQTYDITLCQIEYEQSADTAAMLALGDAGLDSGVVHLAARRRNRGIWLGDYVKTPSGSHRGSAGLRLNDNVF